MSVRRTITIELEVEGAHADEHRVRDVIEREYGSDEYGDRGWRVVSAEIVENAKR